MKDVDNSNSINSFSEHVFEFAHMSEDSKEEYQLAYPLIFNHCRFDYLIKYLFLKFSESDWHRQLYINHIKYFNNFQEINFPSRNTGEDFIKDFEMLSSTYSYNSPYLIPVDINGCAYDGAHRLAISAHNNGHIRTMQLEKNTPDISFEFNYKFFLKKGMPLEYMDYVAYQCAKLCSETYLLVLFPSCQEQWSTFEDIIESSQNEVYYSKSIYLNDIGKNRFIESLYEGEPWLRETNNDTDSGLTWKTKQCFAVDTINCAKVYLIKSTHKNLIHLKEHLRVLAGIGNHSVHTTDTREDTIRIASLVFNANSLEFINSAKRDKFLKFDELFQKFQNVFKDNLLELDSDDFCIDGSALMSVCGLRDCNDLDYLAIPGKENIVKSIKGIDCHNSYIISQQYKVFSKINITDIITSPLNHFYYKGYKFMIPFLLSKQKEERNEPKDIVDCDLLENYYSFIDNRVRISNSKNPISDDWYSEFDRRYDLFTKKYLKKPISLNSPFTLSQDLIEYCKSSFKSFSIDDNQKNIQYYFEIFLFTQGNVELFFSLAEKIILELTLEKRVSALTIIGVLLNGLYKNSINVPTIEDVTFFTRGYVEQI
jgi:wbfN protein